MTFIGKLFVMINLAISLLMAATAFGLYVSGIDWTDRAAKEGQAEGKLLSLRKGIDDVLARLPLAENSLKAARQEVREVKKFVDGKAETEKIKGLLVIEDERRDERDWTDKEMRKLAGGKEPVFVVDSVASAANPAARPVMAPATAFPGQDPPALMTREVSDESLKDYQKENVRIREALAKKVKEDEDLTRRLGGDKEGDPEPRLRGIRREIAEERVKRLGLIDEQGITKALEVNVAVESELILKRLDDLDGRIQELGRYLKKKHNVDVPSKWR